MRNISHFWSHRRHGRRTGFTGWGCLLFLSLGWADWAQAGALERIRERGAVVVAYREDSVPLSYPDPQGRPLGFAVDVCQHVANKIYQRLGMPARPVRYIKVDSVSRFTAIETQQADLECASTTNTAERRLRVSFAIPHYISGARLLVKGDSKAKGLEDLDGKVVVTTQGTTMAALLHRLKNEKGYQYRIAEVPTDASAVDWVSEGKAEGFVMDDVLLFAARAKHPKPDEFKIVGKLLSIEPLAIMLGKDDTSFKNVVDEAIKQLIRSQEVRALYDKWFMAPIPVLGIRLDLPPNYLLKDYWRFPTDFVPG